MREKRHAAVAPNRLQVVIHNRLPLTYPRRVALERAIVSALAPVEGAWEVTVELPDERALVVAVVAPDGSSWTMSCCDPQRWAPEAVAEAVRGACT